MRILALLLLLAAPVLADPTSELLARTGLVQLEEGEVPVFGKTHRGYPLRMQAAAGDVWGRYFARLALAEASQALPEAVRRIYFDVPGPGDLAGSRADKVLSEVMGYPLTVTVVIDHDLPVEPLFVYTGRSVFRPELSPPEQAALPGTALRLYCDNPELATRVLEQQPLRERLGKLRNPVLAVTEGQTVFAWAGDEVEYSAMIRDHDSYPAMLIGIFDTLVDLTETAALPQSEVN